ncbi:hypothetical protein M404DRAFT_19923 [Pisolithus tinctorius Marx 270]|uniref:Uncharacterized protein n=1 Tax=Pisolithus tinctorius Marx 270 TaxID=870435 RepID=A0A0C3KRB3_PISTI|nr:hypothetical protein M404DRAFT_19923 [Pisolithus tinctorius Marx 270]
MSSQCKSKTPQPTPGHVHNYSQVVDDKLVILTDDSTDTEQEKTVEKAHRQEENEHREREHEVERKAKREEAKRLTSAVYNVNTTQKVPGASVVVITTRRAPCTCCVVSLTVEQCEPGQGKTRACVPCHNKKKTYSWMREEVVAGPSWKRAGTGSSQGEKKKRTQGKGKVKVTETEEVDDEREIGREDEEEPQTPHEGPSGVGVHMRWVEWEQEWQLQAAERYAEAHERAALAFERMVAAAERMTEVAERTADKWGTYRTWVEWAGMRRRQDAHEAKMAELKRAGGGWKRPQSEAVEDKDEEADEGAEGDNKEEVGGEKEGGGEQEVVENKQWKSRVE